MTKIGWKQTVVIPAKAGIHIKLNKTPGYQLKAGMTKNGRKRTHIIPVIPGVAKI